MGFRQGTYATLWNVYERNGNVTVQLSTSYKKKDSNPAEYIVDWQGFATCKFDALEFVKGLPKPIPKNGVRVKIGNCDVKTKYDADKKITYTNYEVLGLEDASFNNDKPNASASGKAGNSTYGKSRGNNNRYYSGSEDDNQLPF